MSGHASNTLQKGIFDKLTTALATAGPTGGAVPIKDHVTADLKPPYVVLGEGAVEPFDTDTEVGQEHRILLHVYTDKNRGKKDCKTLLKLIYDALHQQQAAITLAAGAAMLMLYFEFEEVLLDSDGATFHGVTRYRAITTET